MASREANWIDGLRGIASFTVVLGHICTAFVPWLHSPASDPDSEPHLFQRPFFRLVVGGRAAVAFFFLITGYVNAIGPLTKARAGNIEGAHAGLARSALSRSGRLVLPTALATTISWLLAQIDGYRMIRHVDATWIRQGWHRQEMSWWAALRGLVTAQAETWTLGWNEYDGTQWTLHLFLEGSMAVYMTMLATLSIRPKARLVAYAALYTYFWLFGKGLAQYAMKGLNITVGMLAAETRSHYRERTTSLLPGFLPFIMILAGLFLAGYPQDGPEKAPWSLVMRKIMVAITMKEADVRRHWDHIGATLVFLGVLFSGRAQSVLNTPLLHFMGRVSFPVYLIHNTLMKTVLAWMVYLPSAMNPQLDPKGHKMDLDRGSVFHVVVSVIIFFYVLYRLAAFWVEYVDPVCAKIVDSVMRWAYAEPGFIILKHEPPSPASSGKTQPCIRRMSAL